MNDGLPTFREGFAIAPQLTARNLNAMVAAIRRNRITPGPNQLLSQDGGGTQVWDRRRRASGVGAVSAPRTLLCSRPTGATDKVVVSVGMIRNIMPTIGGVPLDASTAPQLTITTTGYVYLVGVFNASTGVPSAFSVVNGATIPADTSTAGHKALATVTLTTGAITSLAPVVWNLSDVIRCGSTTYQWGGFGA